MSNKVDVTFDVTIGENQFEGEATITPGRPQEGPSYSSSGQPEEPPTAEIHEVRLIDPDGEKPSMKFSTEGLYTMQRGVVSRQPIFSDLDDDIEDAALVSWLDSL